MGRTSNRLPAIAIVGRPNVGKSTLFNRLVGRRAALVHDTPGVTRDRKEGEARLFDLRFVAVDTAGLEEADAEAIERRMIEQTLRAIAAADVALFLIDARAGVTPIDQYFAEHLRRGPAPVVLVANKCEGRAADAGVLDAFGLGLGDPVVISAEHGEGMGALHDAISAHIDPDHDDESDTAKGEEDGRPLSLAIVGRPNAGKSTLLNRLLDEERVITGPEPGLTRDSIAVDWSWGERAIRLIDTAGLRRRARIESDLEKLTVADTFRAVQFADVVVLLVDAQTIQDFGAGIEKQDLTIARRVEEEGRALVIAANKWDTVDAPDATRKAIRESLEKSLSQLRGVPLVCISAREGAGLDRLMTEVLDAEAAWNSRVTTGRLNQWLEAMQAEHQPPLASGRRIKIRYMTQVKSRPPTFALFVNKPTHLPDAYLRYLTNGLRSDFGLQGVPIRLHLRKGGNPYVREKR